MAERFTSPDRTLTPEYWDGHHVDDDCEWEIPDMSLLELFNQSQHTLEIVEAELIRRVAEPLERYQLLRHGSHVPLSKFEKGSTFVADQCPNGTLIRITSESFLCGYFENGYDPYRSSELFGLVVDARGIKEMPIAGNVILYMTNAQKIAVFTGLEGEIPVGEVKHTRRRYKPNWDHHTISRVNKVEIISMGAGSPRRVTSPSPSSSAVLAPGLVRA